MQRQQHVHGKMSHQLPKLGKSEFHISLSVVISHQQPPPHTHTPHSSIQQLSSLLQLDPLSGPVILDGWPRVGVSVVQLRLLAPDIQPVADFHDGSCPGTASRCQAQTGAALGAPALTGGAQQALNAAINLHHGGFESEQGACDRRYVSGNEV